MEEFKIIAAIFSSLTSPVVAIGVAYIAFQQWKVNSSKELRESNQHKIHVYLAVKKLLHSFDNTLKVDLKLYEEMQEALAIGDFIFDEKLNEWLLEVDSEAGCWLNINSIIQYGQNELSIQEYSMRYGEEKIKLNISQDKMQNFHCELLNKFKDHIIL
jgi:hypothetical protein